MSPRLSTALPLRLLRAHIRSGAQNDAHLAHRGRRDRRRLRRRSATARGSARAPSRDRSPAPSPCRRARTLMFAGFRSRWMIPCSCAASSASAICCAIGSASSSGIGPRAIRSASVSPSTSSRTSALGAVDLVPAVNRAQCSDGSARRALRFALETGHAIRSSVKARAGP